MKKLRFFFYNSTTKKPIHGLRVSGIIKTSSGKKGENLPLSILSTNIDGYVSFNPDICDLTRINYVRIFIQGRRRESWEFKEEEMGAPNSIPNEIEVDKELIESISLTAQGLSVENPDKWDFRYTNLANRGTELILGSGDCSKMIPQHVQKECYEIFNVVPCSINDKKVELICPNGEMEVAYSDLLISEVCWDWLGYSLGKLVNSFSLAPCEKQKIWIKAWRIDQESYDESTETSQYRESFIQESMAQSVKNLNIGLNINPPSDVSTGSDEEQFLKMFERIVGIVLQGAGQGGSSPANLVNIGIKSQKNLINQIQRTTSRLSTKHRISVQRESSKGDSRTQKRTLINQNQCHSQTTNLYEVVDNYEVTTCIKEKRKGLMIKYPNDKFTKKRIFCNRHLFRGNLLDDSLETCLDSIGKVASCCEPNDGEECVKVNKIKVHLTIGRNGTAGRIHLVLTINGRNHQYLIPKQGNDDRYKKSHSYELEVNLNGSVCVEDVTAIGLFNDPTATSGAFNIDKLSASYTSPSFSGEKAFYNVNMDNREFNNGETDFFTPEPDIPGEKPMNICSEEEICCSKQLLKHFNCNKLYYNQIIWRFENPQERIVRFEKCLLNNISLACQIVNQPIAVYGQWVVFELADSDPRPMQPCIKEHSIISLPTAGLFQETLLGRCNSCEEPNIPVLEARRDFPCPCGCKENNNNSISLETERISEE